jgi:hypothetical protein
MVKSGNCLIVIHFVSKSIGLIDCICCFNGTTIGPCDNNDKDNK